MEQAIKSRRRLLSAEHGEYQIGLVSLQKSGFHASKNSPSRLSKSPHDLVVDCSLAMESIILAYVVWTAAGLLTYSLFRAWRDSLWRPCRASQRGLSGMSMRSSPMGMSVTHCRMTGTRHV